MRLMNGTKPGSQDPRFDAIKNRGLANSLRRLARVEYPNDHNKLTDQELMDIYAVVIGTENAEDEFVKKILEKVEGY